LECGDLSPLYDFGVLRLVAALGFFGSLERVIPNDLKAVDAEGVMVHGEGLSTLVC
jgi:hypothetical protein